MQSFFRTDVYTSLKHKNTLRCTHNVVSYCVLALDQYICMLTFLKNLAFKH